MSVVFQNIDPPHPSPPGECVPSPPCAGGWHTRWAERGWGVNILEDAGHSSVLYICKYSVLHPFSLFNQDVDGTSNVPFTCLLSNFARPFFWNPIRRNMELAKLWLPVRGWGGLGSSESPWRIFAKLKCLIHYFRIVWNLENFAYFALLQESHLRIFFSEIKLNNLELIIKSVSPKSVEFASTPLDQNYLF